MPKQTKADQLAAMLEANGYREIRGTSRKYRKFTKSSDGMFYFVGKAGALRHGRNIAESISLTDYYAARLLNQEAS